MSTSSYLLRHTGLDSIASTLADSLYRPWAIQHCGIFCMACTNPIDFQLVLFHMKVTNIKQFISLFFFFKFLARQFAVRFLYKNPIRIINFLKEIWDSAAGNSFFD